MSAPEHILIKLFDPRAFSLATDQMLGEVDLHALQDSERDDAGGAGFIKCHPFAFGVSKSVNY